MKPVSPVIPDTNMPELVVAEHQDAYQNLSSIILEGGVILCRWKLDEEERKRVAETGDIYLLQWTGGGGVTPMLLQTELPPINVVVSNPDPLPQMMSAARRSSHIVNEAKRHGFEIFEDNCSDCRCVVVYTEATKDTLLTAPDTKLVCTICFNQMQIVHPEIEGVFLPNTAGEMDRVREVLEENSGVGR